MTDQRELLERLEAVESSGSGDVVTNSYRNPDGPEAAAEIRRLREGLEEIVGWHSEAPHTFPDWRTAAGALAEMAQNVLDGRAALTEKKEG